MKSSQSLRHGSAKLSPPNPQFKCGESSSKKSENISKYFSKNKPDEDSQFDSPYKKCLSEIKYEVTTSDDSKDFRTPKPIKVYKKIQNKATVSLSRKNKPKPKSNSKKCKPSTSTNSIFKTTQHNFGLLDVNPDHLQMALALSKSTYAAEYPEQSKEIEDFPAFLTPDKIPKGKTTLERYGFKSNRLKLCTEIKREPFEIPKKNKNSKFRFITPTLKTRSVEERESIIAAKISLILNQNKTFHVEDYHDVEDGDLYSEILRQFKGNNSLFAANGFGLEQNEYYNKNLNISPSKSKCGCLLKRWEEIPGRDKSPVKNQSMCEVIKKCSDNTQTDSETTTSSEFGIYNEEYKSTTHISLSKSSGSRSNTPERFSVSQECISPDLFESDSDNSSQSLLSPLIKKRTVLTSQSDNYNKENVPKCINFDEEINNIVNTNNLMDDIPQSSESEDTEQLYLKSLQSEEEFLSENSPPKKCTDLNDWKFEDECIILSSSSDCSNDCPPKTLNKKLNCNETLSTVLEEEENTEQLYLNSQKSENEFVTNLTQNSPFKRYNDSISPKFSSKNEDCTNTYSTNEKFEEECIILSSSSDCSNDYPVDKFTNNTLENENFEDNKETNCTSETSIRISFGLDNCSKTLNVTDYIHQILNENDSKIDQDQSNNLVNNSSGDIDLQNENELALSQESSSLESIVISDEELNYSSIHSKDTKCKKYFYDSSDAEEVLINDRNETEDVDMDEVYRISSALRNKYQLKTALTPIHNRVSELRTESSPKTSITKTCLEDSFNEVLENSSVFKAMEDERNEPPIPNSPPVQNNGTPDKLIVPTSDAEKTPDNNLIIKTKDVTPLPNYDEMNTPSIVNELHKFGLKPLKRQRGIKLLKYLYECTHPLVGPNGIEELSSDEDEQKRVVKKRKKSKGTHSSNTNSVKNNSFMGDQSDIEIVGDALLQNQNLDELIFERKQSVRISSCRVPLQIVWHNFLSKNPHIKENILFYEPLQLEVLHAMLKEQTGCKFHIQDLLTFFDRKCITIRTAQGSQKRGQKN